MTLEANWWTSNLFVIVSHNMVISWCIWVIDEFAVDQMALRSVYMQCIRNVWFREILLFEGSFAWLITWYWHNLCIFSIFSHYIAEIRQSFAIQCIFNWKYIGKIDEEIRCAISGRERWQHQITYVREIRKPRCMWVCFSFSWFSHWTKISLCYILCIYFSWNK